MATRSYIGKVINGRVHSIYCHWDGYPEGVGSTLLQHYDSEKVNRLLELGGISALQETVEESAVKAYHEDINVDTREDYFSNNVDVCGIEYSYLLEDGVWKVYDHHKDKEYDLAMLLGVSEETADPRLNPNLYATC